MTIELVVNSASGDDDPIEFARSAEALGFHGVSASDHFFRRSAYPHVWVTVAAMAMATSRVVVGTSFANNLFRSPVEFAQASLTMQRLSAGRFEAGIGAGWLAAEVRGGGLQFPEPAVRARRYREAVQIVGQLFRDGCCQFEGEFYSIDVPVIGPHCPLAPQLAVSVGGPWTMRNVAPLADRVELKPGRATRGGDLDMATLASVTREEIAGMVSEVREVAPDVPIGLFTMIAAGDAHEVAHVASALGDGLYSTFVGEPAKVLDGLRSLEDLGIDRVQVSEFVKGSALRLAV